MAQHSWTSGQVLPSPRTTATNNHPDKQVPGVEPNAPRPHLYIGLYACSSHILIESQSLSDQVDDSGASRAVWRSLIKRTVVDKQPDAVEAVFWTVAPDDGTESRMSLESTRQG
jgi:hypothetical protein